MYCVASKSNDISLKYGDITIIFKKAMVRYLGFQNLEIFHIRSSYYSQILHLPTKFLENQEQPSIVSYRSPLIAVELSTNTMFKINMASVCHLNLKVVNFGHRILVTVLIHFSIQRRGSENSYFLSLCVNTWCLENGTRYVQS